MERKTSDCGSEETSGNHISQHELVETSQDTHAILRTAWMVGGRSSQPSGQTESDPHKDKDASDDRTIPHSVAHCSTSALRDPALEQQTKKHEGGNSKFCAHSGLNDDC